MYVKVHVIAGAKKEKIQKENECTYRIYVKEPAERNMANTRVREILCTVYNIEKGGVRLIAGHRSPSKIFDIELKV